MDWKPIDSAPKDGTWILLEGEFAGGGTSSVILARYSPHTCETGTYEWQTLERSIFGLVDGPDDCAVPEWNWYCEGRATKWSLPPPPESTP